MREVSIIGVGMTDFGKFVDIPIEELAKRALWDALKDAGVKPRQIETAYCGNMLAGRISGHYSCMAQIMFDQAGIMGIPIVAVENACSSGSTAFREAWIAVASGLYDMAIALGVEKMTGRLAAPLKREKNTMEGVMGFTMPGVWASRAKKHMETYGTTLEQLAKVSVKNHANGCLNPRAQYKKEFTVEEVLNSPMISEPLTMYHACPIGDGAAAAIVTSSELARKYTRTPVKVAAVALTSGTYEYLRDFTSHDLEKRASKEAYDMAGIGPEDLDFAEVHDCYTIAEVIRCESLGLCRPGEYPVLLDEGKWDLNGDFPINPSGGLLAKGHPVGATGVAQIVEVVQHFRGLAGTRQVQGAKVALTHCSGGSYKGDTGACAVSILKK